jgi:hypothetical protein
MVALENLVLAELFKEFTAFREIRLFITIFGSTLSGDYRSVLELYIAQTKLGRHTCYVAVIGHSIGSGIILSGHHRLLLLVQPKKIRYCSRESNLEPPE